MPAEDFGGRFYFRDKPAWHNLGHVGTTPQGAMKSLMEAGWYDLYLEGLKTTSGLEVPGKAILRSPTYDDPQTQFISTVGDDYELITPTNICSAFDRKVHAPVETLGALKGGSVFFLTTQLPSWDVLGDELMNFLLIDAPMNGGGIYIRETDIRVVCWNTLIAARDTSTQFYRVRHTAGALDRFEEWLEYAWRKAVANIENVKELFGFLAKTPVQESDVPILLSQVYPDPNPPLQDAPDYVIREREERYEANKKWILKQRSLAEELFQGAGFGQDTVAAKGTAWGLWNAIVELNDYVGNGSPDIMAFESIFGWRARYKEQAFTSILDHALSG